MNIILKMTTACNGTCVYCSAYKEKPQHLSLEVAERALAITAEYLRADRRARVNLILHGGEPLLRSSRFYNAFDKLVDQQLGALRRRLSVAMQSNLTLLTPSKARALKPLLTRPIGTSYDIYPGIRGIRGCRSLDDRWYDAMHVTHDANIDTGVVYVVHRQAVEETEKLWAFLRNHPYVDTVRFNPLYEEGMGKSEDAQQIGITAAQWGEFLIKGWRIFARDGFRPGYAPFAEFYSAHIDRQPQRMSCSHKGDCAHTHMGIDPDGSIYNCGRWSDTQEFTFGTVFDADRRSILTSEVRLKLAERGAVLKNGPCADCDWWAYCHGGCPNDAYLEHGTVEAKTKWCEGYLAFFEECLRPLGDPVRREESE